MELSALDEVLKRSFSRVKEDIQLMRAEIDALKAEGDLLKTEVAILKSEKTALIENQKALLKIVKEVKENIISAGNIAHSGNNASYRNIAQSGNISSSEIISSANQPAKKSVLSAAENQILMRLQQNQQLSYRDIAQMLGKSPNTIKNHINSIQKKGFAIGQRADINGTKRFTVEI